MAPKPAKQKHMRLQSYGFEVLPGPAGVKEAAAVDSAKELAAQNYRALFEHNFDGVYSLDLQGRFVTGNRGLERITGYTADELAGASFLMYIEPEHQEVRRRMFARALAGETVNYDTVARHKSGELRHTNVTYVPIVVDGQVSGVFAIAKDLTDRIRHEQELERLTATLEERVRNRTAELEALNQGLEAFTSSVSHDLRAPIHSIDGFSHALRQALGDEIPGRAAHYLDRITNSVRHMNDMVDGLLALAKATRGALHQEKVDMSALAAETLTRLAEKEPARVVHVRVQPGLAAQGDSRLLRQVLENLLGNAWKFSSGANPARISFTRTEDGAFCVTDNGAGFDMDYVGRLFHPFHRLHTNAEFPGNGIGLATVQAIVTRHGGRVWAESQVGQGARFYFTLGP